MSFQFILFCCLLALLTVAGNDSSQHLQNLVIGPVTYREQYYRDECGGVIPVGSDHVTFLQYKFGQKHDDKEFCIWILHLEDKMEVLSLSQITHFEGNDGLVIYNWTKGPQGGLEAKRLENNQTLDLIVKSPFMFLTFISDSIPGNGLGFQVELRGTGEFSPRKGTAYLWTEDHGAFKYPPSHEGIEFYPNNDYFAGVLQAHQLNSYHDFRKEIILRDLDTEEERDVLEIYRLHNFWYSDEDYAVQIGEFSGHHTGIVRDATTNYVYPQLYLFYSDGNNTGRGFTIQWSNSTY